MAVFMMEFVKPGMVVGTDVLNDRGQLLLSAGTEITTKHLDTLRGLGVSRIDIKGATDEEAQGEMLKEVDPLRLARAETELQKLFCHTDLTHAPIAELLRVCTLRKVRLG